MIIYGRSWLSSCLNARRLFAITLGKALPVDGPGSLQEQLKIRTVVDGRKEESGKALIRTPPKDATEGGRAWLVMK